MNSCKKFGGHKILSVEEAAFWKFLFRKIASALL